MYDMREAYDHAELIAWLIENGHQSLTESPAFQDYFLYFTGAEFMDQDAVERMSEDFPEKHKNWLWKAFEEFQRDN